MVSPVQDQGLEEWTESRDTIAGEAGHTSNVLDGPSSTIGGHCSEIYPVKKEDEDDDIPFTLHNFVFFLNKNKKKKKFITTSSVKNSFKTFRNFVLEKNLLKLPWSDGFKILYKAGLLIFFVINFLYPIIVFAVKTQHVGYNVVCGVISLIGLIFELYEIIPDLYRYIKNWKQKRQNQGNPEAESNSNDSGTNVTITKDPRQTENEHFSYVQEAKFIFKEFIIDSLGEILIYPSLICNLYGFINERG